MINTSGAHPTVLDANRKLVRNKGRWLDGDVYDLVRLSQSLGASADTVADCRTTIDKCPINGLIVPCSLIHWRDLSCWHHNFMLFLRVIIKMMPVHLALNLLPQPVSAAIKSAKLSLQSSVFLAAFIASFQSMICVQRKLLFPRPSLAILAQPSGHKAFYWAAGVLSAGLSLLIEQKRRRGELALYVFPKAMESLYLTLLDRKSLKRPLPRGCEIALAACAFSILMAWYQDEQGSKHMSPTVLGVMRRLVGEN
jgi:hypothetical protein